MRQKGGGGGGEKKSPVERARKWRRERYHFVIGRRLSV